LIGLTLTLPSALHAQEGPFGPPRDGWNVQAGMMVFQAPACAGSDQSQVKAFPMVKADHSQRWFFGSNPAVEGMGLGYRPVRGEHVAWDLGAGWSAGRKASRADVLAGMGDQRASTWLGTAFSYRLGPFHASLSLAHALDSDAGNHLKLGLGGPLLRGGPWMAGFQASAGFADARGMRYEFGVEPWQAALRQDLISAGDGRLRAGEARAYQPGGGPRDVALGLNLGGRLDRHWNLVSMVTATHLFGRAQDSPLVRRKNTLFLGLGCSYGF
jgi:outer membrane protein